MQKTAPKSAHLVYIRIGHSESTKCSLNQGLGSVLKLHEGAYDGLPEAPIFTESRPFDEEELFDSPTYQKSRRRMREELDVSKPFVDIRPLDEKDSSLFMEKSFHRMWHTMQPISR